MREIKFRAWDKEKKRWYHTELEFKGFSLFGECMLVCPPRIKDLSNLEVTQFTGLKDKNGKEIYEGDIVEYTMHRKVQVIEEVFIDGEMGYELGIGYNFDYQKGKIIGNIYENPELLEAK